MIDRIYKTLLFFSNNQLQGNVSPAEYNIAAHNKVLEKYEEYFFESNILHNREGRGLISRGLDSPTNKLAEKIGHFLKPISIGTNAVNTPTDVYGSVTIPEDLRYLDSMTPTGYFRPFDIAPSSHHFNTVARLKRTRPTLEYPLALKLGDSYRILPLEITSIDFMYLRNPKKPNWTYTIVPGSDVPLYNPSSSSFQDIDMHISEEADLTLKILSAFGINLKEKDLVEYAEREEAQKTQKENSI